MGKQRTRERGHGTSTCICTRDQGRQAYHRPRARDLSTEMTEKTGARWREMDLCGADDYRQMEVYLGFWHVEIACEHRVKAQMREKLKLEVAE